ncbi:MAG: ORF6N domain-containing protein [Deltaproteobacteria bacterium]|nr:ORF6N domain-containing protein [Deltaproteobacteria bacterium]
MELMIPLDSIKGKILLVRGQKVLLDRDLASLYEVETRALNQAVRRNRERFPSDFMLELSRDEIRHLSQIVTSPGLKNAPNVFAFTEQGVAMLAGVLRSERAIQVNIAIMRTFVKMRGMVLSNQKLAKRLDDLERRYDRQFEVVLDTIKELMEPPHKEIRQIGFAAGSED